MKDCIRLGREDYTIRTALLENRYIDGDRARTSAGAFRYVWPSELDLMAQLAGMRLEHRWADWHRSPFTDASRAHISVWRKPA